MTTALVQRPDRERSTRSRVMSPRSNAQILVIEGATSCIHALGCSVMHRVKVPGDVWEMCLNARRGTGKQCHNGAVLTAPREAADRVGGKPLAP